MMSQTNNRTITMKRKVLLVGVCDIPHSTNVGVLDALHRLGYEVDVFNFRTVEKDASTAVTSPMLNSLNTLAQKLTSRIRRYPWLLVLRRSYFFFPARRYMNQSLLKKATDSHYDWCLFMKTDTVDWITVRDISKHMPTWYFFMDPPKECTRIQAQKYAKYATYASATFTSVVDQFKKENPRSQWIIEGEMPELFEKKQAVPKTIDVIFVGSTDPKRASVIDYLKQHHIRVQWYGDGGDYPPVYQDALMALYHKSKIILHINRKGDGFSNRVIQALLSGSFLCSEHSDDLDHFFEKAVHLESFTDKESCLNLIQTYLKEEAQRERIAKDGYDYAKANYTWIQQIKKLTDTIDPSHVNHSAPLQPHPGAPVL